MSIRSKDQENAQPIIQRLHVIFQAERHATLRFSYHVTNRTKRNNISPTLDTQLLLGTIIIVLARSARTG